ncbi:MAG: NYN domain-containing protein [Candidatus ainarchaeum sp.]|nr:NYN domain-containing protein [Candidatus ainarchaeum sp.]
MCLKDSLIIFIDNAYLKKVYSFYNKSNFNFDIKKFSMNLAKENKLFCKKIYLYDAPPFENNSLKMEKYNSFKKYLKKRNIFIREGKLQKISDRYTQKGVDSLLTMDLLINSFEKNAFNFIIITADTDFVPVIAEVKNKAIKVILYCLINKSRHFFLSNHLLSICDEVKIIKETHFN